MSIVISVEGGPVWDREIKSFSLSSSFTGDPDEWAATIFSPDFASLLNLELRPITIEIDGNLQLIGRIERSQIGADSSAVRFSGRDFRGDLVACHVDPSFRIKKGDTLKSSILRAAAPAGIVSVNASGNWAQRDALSGSLAGEPGLVGFDDAKVDDFKPKPEESIWVFCRRLAARFGALILTNGGRGNLLLAKPNFDQSPIYKMVRNRAGIGNTVETSEADRNYRDVPTFALIAGKEWEKKGKESKVVWSGGPVFLGREGTIHERIAPDTDRPGETWNVYRLFFRRSNDARNQAEVDLTFNRAVAERFHNLLHYSATLDGFTDPVNGNMWTVDTMVSVADEVAGVNDTLWLSSRELTYDETSGTATHVECWIPETFNLTEPGLEDPRPPAARGGPVKKADVVLTGAFIVAAANEEDFEGEADVKFGEQFIGAGYHSGTAAVKASGFIKGG